MVITTLQSRAVFVTMSLQTTSMWVLLAAQGPWIRNLSASQWHSGIPIAADSFQSTLLFHHKSVVLRKPPACSPFLQLALAVDSLSNLPSSLLALDSNATERRRGVYAANAAAFLRIQSGLTVDLKEMQRISACLLSLQASPPYL